MRVHRPTLGVLAFYDGRVPGARIWSEAPNWLDDGGYALGIASYAVLDGDEALVYDTHLSVPHAEIVRETLRGLGARRFTVVLSHWHLDHVAGNAAFADWPILAHPLTAATLAAERPAIEGAVPPIRPLVMPTGTVGDGDLLRVGGRAVTVRHFDIHSRDGTVLELEDGWLLAGDTLEDPITYLDEPERLEVHIGELDRMAALEPARILPNHGNAARIAAGGYGPALIDATRSYLRRLLRCRDDPALAALPLDAFIAEELAGGTVASFTPYAAVHVANVAKVLATAP
jgi:glyoxylase-like metal-dependent hydrolase (beta-lactamase superfamily II)